MSFPWNATTSYQQEIVRVLMSKKGVLINIINKEIRFTAEDLRFN